MSASDHLPPPGPRWGLRLATLAAWGIAAWELVTILERACT